MEPFMPAQNAARKPKLLDQFRDLLRPMNYAYRTERHTSIGSVATLSFTKSGTRVNWARKKFETS
jgi:hypothetical protein